MGIIKLSQLDSYKDVYLNAESIERFYEGDRGGTSIQINGDVNLCRVAELPQHVSQLIKACKRPITFIELTARYDGSLLFINVNSIEALGEDKVGTTIFTPNDNKGSYQVKESAKDIKKMIEEL